tara:strand:+ start:46 stop:621 length:576 start_codon:yes stop_codon:yes gene_type:complete
MTPKKCVFVTVTAILCAILFIAGIIPMLKYYDYDKAICLVTQIDYPQVLPNVNHTDNWDECRCGRSCKTLSPCINLYVKILKDTNTTNESNHYLAKKDVYSIRDKCTFYNRSCKDNENILNLYKDLDEAKTIYNEYNNKTIKCYYNNNSVVLKNNHSWTIIIIFSILIIITGVAACFCCKEPKTQTRSDFV